MSSWTSPVRRTGALLAVLLAAPPIAAHEWISLRDMWSNTVELSPHLQVADFRDELEYLMFDPYGEIVVTTQELNPCGEWSQLAMEAALRIIREEYQGGRPGYRARCYRHRNGDRTIAVAQSWEAVFVYRNPAGSEALHKVLAADGHSGRWYDGEYRLVIVDDELTGILLFTYAANMKSMLQLYRADGWRAPPQFVNALFRLRSEDNQLFLAFEEDYSGSSAEAWSVSALYGRGVEELARVPVVSAVDSEGIQHVGGQSFLSAVTAFRDLLHGYWLGKWELTREPAGGVRNSSVRRPNWFRDVQLAPDSEGPKKKIPPPPSRRPKPTVPCPDLFPISPELELDYDDVRDPVVCGVRMGPTGWWQDQQEADSTAPLYSLEVQIVRGDFPTTAQVAGFFPEDSLRARPGSAADDAASGGLPDLSAPSPETAQYWCIPVRMGQNCNVKFISGNGWSGFMADATFGYHRKIGGYLGVLESCRAAVTGSGGYGIAVEAIGGCGRLQAFLETVHFGQPNGEPTGQ